MKLGATFPRSFYERPCLDVAPDLLGALLVRKLSDGKLWVGRIVEVEAYLGVGEDPASHAYRRETPRNRAMFGPAGRLYVYQSYGMHICANVVCEQAGRAAAVLLRAVEPIREFSSGVTEMCRNRNLHDRPKNNSQTIDTFLRQLTNGPGKLTQAFGITLDDYGADLTRGSLTIRKSLDARSGPILQSGRIGISTACERPYRFYLAGNPYVSPARAAKKR